MYKRTLVITLLSMQGAMFGSDQYAQFRSTSDYYGFTKQEWQELRDFPHNQPNVAKRDSLDHVSKDEQKHPTCADVCQECCGWACCATACMCGLILICDVKQDIVTDHAAHAPVIPVMKNAQPLGKSFHKGIGGDNSLRKRK